ncbi:ABC transporter substrate-binding protein [Photobacterium atrarenae]|uniref:Probable sugar-binding periplasmic protein n=1 Tax=Photobacterium atrarenae TaxID=865757 RepID=A0ABY5GK50_9GAMM|nr:ABC transporter substrate-binding protein [Photobacterium atrarenae]UTV29110.1 ABC transporter substrate-binding protein [Photobacterium atrarenae]
MKYLLLLILSCWALVSHASKTVHFLHWWTAEGEAIATKIVENTLQASGYSVANVPIQGGGGGTAKSILQARAIAGNPPDMALLEGPAIKSWAALGFLHSLGPVAQKHEWGRHLNPLVREIHQFDREYVAIPITIHRLNWVWVNHEVLAKYHLPVPRDWQQMLTVFRQLKQHGVPPLALGNEPWQVVQLFENIAFGLGGPDYYRRAFIELDVEALDSAVTREALTLFRQISQIVLPDLSRQRWEEATQMLLNGQRAFQITGDWVAGELMALAGQFPETISCYAAPARQPGFIYNMDSFALFKSPTLDEQQANDIAGILSNPNFLRKFNQTKGAIPARRDVSLDGFNACSVKAMADFQHAEQQETLVPSIIDSMAVSPVIQKATTSELYRFFNTPSVSVDEIIRHIKHMDASGLTL